LILQGIGYDGRYGNERDEAVDKDAMRVDESNSVVDPYASKIVRKGHLGWDEVVEDEGEVLPCENVTLNTRYFYFR